MTIGRKTLTGNICAYAVALVCGLGGYALRVDAQSVDSRMTSRSISGVAPISQAADAVSEKLRKQVAAALHADPYLDDEHINIAVDRGVVVLSGLVYSDWDLRTALRTARKAAGHSRVIDSLSIEQGGR